MQKWGKLSFNPVLHVVDVMSYNSLTTPVFLVECHQLSDRFPNRYTIVERHSSAQLSMLQPSVNNSILFFSCQRRQSASSKHRSHNFQFRGLLSTNYNPLPSRNTTTLKVPLKKRFDKLITISNRLYTEGTFLNYVTQVRAGWGKYYCDTMKKGVVWQRNEEGVGQKSQICVTPFKLLQYYRLKLKMVNLR